MCTKKKKNVKRFYSTAVVRSVRGRLPRSNCFRPLGPSVFTSCTLRSNHPRHAPRSAKKQICVYFIYIYCRHLRMCTDRTADTRLAGSRNLIVLLVMVRVAVSFITILSSSAGDKNSS